MIALALLADPIPEWHAHLATCPSCRYHHQLTACKVGLPLYLAMVRVVLEG